jgi:leucyl aminopeptidase
MVLGLHLVTLSACFDDRFYVRADVEGSFIFGLRELKAEGADLVWTDGVFKLFQTRPLQAKNKIFMVSFPHSATWKSMLKNDDRTMLYFDSAPQHSGYALVEVTSEAQLDGLAIRSHIHEHRRLACGNLKLVELHDETRFAKGNLVASDDNAAIAPKYREIVKISALDDLLAQVKKGNIESGIERLEALGTRYHTKDDGQTTTEVQSMVTEALGSYAATVQRIDHDDSELTSGLTNQESLVVKITGQTNPDEIVIVGAHLDSINNANLDDAPGADDDASGIATWVEALRVIAANNLTFDRTIEFHAYAAEEVGLVGSKDLANRYKTDGKKVVGMLQLDMTAFASDKTNKIYLVTNDSSPTLRRGAGDLLHTYQEGDFDEGTLSGGTSDHESWHNKGFAVVFPFENPLSYNTAIHTRNDTLSKINNLDLAVRMSKLTLSFLGHYAGLESVADQYAESMNELKESLSQDLKIAVTGSDNEKIVAVAADEAIKEIDACIVAALDDDFCVSAKHRFDAVGTAGKRAYYAYGTLSGATTVEGLSLSEGSFLRIFGYDSQKMQVAERVVKLK